MITSETQPLELYGAVLFAELSDETNDAATSDSDDFSSSIQSGESCNSATLEFLKTGYTEDFINISVLDYDAGETVFVLPELNSDIDLSACSDYYLDRNINFYASLGSNSWYSVNLEDSEIIIYGEDTAI